MNKQELKEQVKDYLAIEGVHDARVALKAVLRYIDQLDEPEPVICAENERTTQLVEVPQFVADRIEEYKEIQFGISLIFMINRQIDDDVRFSKWLSSDKDNCELVCRSFLDGYTIEPPKTLQVIVKNYDNTVYKTEIPEDEAMKLIDGWKKDIE